ncbi:MAG: hypothetical protein ACOZBH_02225 [Patescibacteria group bacterium]
MQKPRVKKMRQVGHFRRFIKIHTSIQQDLRISHRAVIEIEVNGRRFEAVFHGTIFGEYAGREIGFVLLPAIDIVEKKPIIEDIFDPSTGKPCGISSSWK